MSLLLLQASSGLDLCAPVLGSAVCSLPTMDSPEYADDDDTADGGPDRLVAPIPPPCTSHVWDMMMLTPYVEIKFCMYRGPSCDGQVGIALRGHSERGKAN